MINCKNCGAQITEDSKFCAHCGTAAAETIQTTESSESTMNSQISPNMANNQTYNTGSQPNYNSYNYNTTPNYNYQTYQKTNGMCIAGFIVSLIGSFILPFISGIVGIILSVIGVKKINSSNEKGKGLGIAGIIIGAVNILIGIGIIIFIIYSINYMYYYF